MTPLRRRIVDYSVAAVLLALPVVVLQVGLRDPGRLSGVEQAVLRISSPLQSGLSWLVGGVGGVGASQPPPTQAFAETFADSGVALAGATEAPTPAPTLSSRCPPALSVRWPPPADVTSASSPAPAFNSPSPALTPAFTRTPAPPAGVLRFAPRSRPTLVVFVPSSCCTGAPRRRSSRGFDCVVAALGVFAFLRVFELFVVFVVFVGFFGDEFVSAEPKDASPDSLAEGWEVSAWETPLIAAKPSTVAPAVTASLLP